MVLRAIILQKEYGCSHLDEWFDGMAYERREMVHTLFSKMEKRVGKMCCMLLYGDMKFFKPLKKGPESSILAGFLNEEYFFLL